MIFCCGVDVENCFDFSPVDTKLHMAAGINELLTKPRHINVIVLFLGAIMRWRDRGSTMARQVLKRTLRSFFLDLQFQKHIVV